MARGETNLMPNDVITKLQRGLLPVTEYRELVEELGIATLPLAPHLFGPVNPQPSANP
jgi:hypothetical protein